MCGRYQFTSPLEATKQLAFHFNVPNLRAVYNAAPTMELPIVRVNADGQRQLDHLRWGLVPRWAKELSIGAKMINARSETVSEKPSFRSAFKSRRCLVLANGYFEWKTERSGKQPFHISFDDGRLFAMAGLWESWRDPAIDPSAGDTQSGEVIETFTIITADANPAVSPIHHRMPVILDPQEHEAWLAEGALELLGPYQGSGLSHHAVSRDLNRVANQHKGLLEPIEWTSEPEQQLLI